MQYPRRVDPEEIFIPETMSAFPIRKNPMRLNPGKTASCEHCGGPLETIKTGDDKLIFKCPNKKCPGLKSISRYDILKRENKS